LIYRAMVAGRVLATGDLQTYFYPYWSEIIRSLRAGELPLWNAYLFAGAPLLANSQAGVFYPLNWPLWLMAGWTPLEAVRVLHLSVLLHLALAALTMNVLARRLNVSPFAAALSGLFYAGSGFLGIHVEHLNQLQGLAWLPLMLLPSRVEASMPLKDGKGTGRFRTSPISVIAWALILLTGHTQTAFIAAVALALWRGGFLVRRLRRRRESGAVMAAVSGLLPFGLGVIAAMVQLIPTLQLAQFSTRSGGLPWREAVSFSVAPWLLHRVLLPPYLVTLYLPEGVAYLGISGLILGGIGLGWGLYRRRPQDVGLAFLIGGGVFLALGGYNPLYTLAVRLGVPGLVHFRAPARFLALVVVGGALVIGRGADVLAAGLPSKGYGRRAGLAAVWLISVAELVGSGTFLPHADATAPAAYTDLRPATAFLASAAREDRARNRPPGRFLSISQMLFEVGDKSETALIYGDALSEGALWALWVSAKQREVLTPNLPMAFGVPAVDGYDGGLLPLRHYGAFSRLLLPEGTLDGRLRENLVGIPDARLLSLLGVRFLLTDKTADAWVDGVFYDRQFQPELQPGQRLGVASLPSDFDANALGLLYAGNGGQVTLTLDSGEVIRDLPAVSMGEAGMKVMRLRWSDAESVTALTVQAGSLPLALGGASLIDERTGAFYPLVLSDRFEMAHSGDIKIYEGVRARSWATVPGRCRVAASESEALTWMKDPAFDPEATLILVDPESQSVTKRSESPSSGTVSTGLRRFKAFMKQGRTDIPQSTEDRWLDGWCEDGGETDALTASVGRIHYRPGTIEVETSTSAPAFLLVKEAWYPGWRAVLRSDAEKASPGREVPVVRGDLMMMAIPLPAGRWEVELTYRPQAVKWGAVLSAVGWLGIGLYAKSASARQE